MKHLHPKQEYIDRYDKITVEDCRRREKFHKGFTLSEDSEIKATPAFTRAVSDMALHYDLLYTTLYWWDKKESTIADWMKKDEHKDHLLTTCSPPENVR